MSDSLLKRRLRLAYPFTVLTAENTVRLVAGEDYRYTFTAPGLESWLPAFLDRLHGQEPLSALLNGLEAEHRPAAMQVAAHLFGERVLVDGAAEAAHVPQRFDAHVTGSGPLRERLASALPDPPPGAKKLVVLCQDRLDFEAAAAESRRCRAQGACFLWISHAAMSRAYVSPLFLPDAGPCFACLLRSFQRISPAPEIYDALREQARQGKALAPVDFPEAGLLILHGLALWKLHEAERDMPAAALYRLHVLECERFDVSTHRVFMDPFCAQCGAAEPT